MSNNGQSNNGSEIRMYEQVKSSAYYDRSSNKTFDYEPQTASYMDALNNTNVYGSSQNDSKIQFYSDKMDVMQVDNSNNSKS